MFIAQYIQISLSELTCTFDVTLRSFHFLLIFWAINLKCRKGNMLIRPTSSCWLNVTIVNF